MDASIHNATDTEFLTALICGIPPAGSSLCHAHRTNRQTSQGTRPGLYGDQPPHQRILRSKTPYPPRNRQVRLPTVHGETNCRTDWHINGQDYGSNFTLNICEPVLSDYSDVVGVSDRTNVSGYYVDTRGDKISIGHVSFSLPVTNGSRASRFPFFRGRRLLLEYRDGSKCESGLRRTTVISFLCDRDLEVAVLSLSSLRRAADTF